MRHGLQTILTGVMMKSKITIILEMEINAKDKKEVKEKVSDFAGKDAKVKKIIYSK